MPTNSPWYRNRRWPDGKTNYEKYQWNRSALDQRNNRNKARRKLWLKVGDPREVDHKDSNALNNGRSNLRAISRVTNRRRGAMKANR